MARLKGEVKTYLFKSILRKASLVRKNQILKVGWLKKLFRWVDPKDLLKYDWNYQKPWVVGGRGIIPHPGLKIDFFLGKYLIDRALLWSKMLKPCWLFWSVNSFSKASEMHVFLSRTCVCMGFESYPSTLDLAFLFSQLYEFWHLNRACEILCLILGSVWKHPGRVVPVNPKNVLRSVVVYIQPSVVGVHRHMGPSVSLNFVYFGESITYSILRWFQSIHP